MRVGLIVPGFSANADDWCIPALRDLVQRLAVSDDVRVLTLRYPYRTGPYRAFGAEVRALGGAGCRGFRSANLWARAVVVLAREHRRRRFDALHAFWATESGAIAVVAGRLLGIPTVVSLAGGEIVGLRDVGYGGQLAPLERLKVRLALGLADVVTAGSRYLLGLARPWLGRRSAATIGRVPLGVDVERFRPPESPRTEGLPVLLHAASLVSVKDQETLLYAAAELHRRGLRFILEIAGTGPLELRLRSLASCLDLASSVRFQGEIPHDRLPDFYRRADLFLLSSRHEAQCLAVLEAASCGVPTAGTAVGVIPELAPEAAWAVPTRDPAALADAVAALLSDSVRRTEMGQTARARAVAEYSLDRSVGHFRRLYVSPR